MSHLGVKYNIDGLVKVRKLLNEKVVIKTGIFEEESTRSDGKSNTQIGLDHEFGTSKVPKRSFLRVPFFLKRKELFDNAKLFLAEGLEKGDLTGFYQKVSGECLNIVIGAFNSGGYGTWQKLSQRTIDTKGNDKILIDSGQLKDSIKSKVVKR